MPLTPEHEYELRDRELRDAREYKLAELELRKTEQRRSPLWTATFAAALIAAAAAAAGHWVVSKKNQADMLLATEEFGHKKYLAERDFEHKVLVAGDEFCYRILAEAMTRHRGQATERIANEVYAVGSVVGIGRYCNGDLTEFADRMRSQTPAETGSAASQASAPGQTASAPASAASAAASSSGPACTSIKSIRELGWTSGHKFNFCRARGYDSVHNPYGSYKSGGFCFKGDAAACIAKIEGR